MYFVHIKVIKKNLPFLNTSSPALPAPVAGVLPLWPSALHQPPASPPAPPLHAPVGEGGGSVVESLNGVSVVVLSLRRVSVLQ